jgi:GNAT superfamily N-acetyltransferase
VGRVTIRRAEAKDISALVTLLVTLFTQEADFTPAPDKHERALKLLLKEPNSTIFVAEVGGVVAGMISLFTFISTALGEPATLVEDFVVAEGHRGRGIGSALMAAVKAHVKETGQHRITLLTDARNARGHKFYEAEGFSRSAMVPWRYYQN